MKEEKIECMCGNKTWVLSTDEVKCAKCKVRTKIKFSPHPRLFNEDKQLYIHPKKK